MTGDGWVSVPTNTFTTGRQPTAQNPRNLWLHNIQLIGTVTSHPGQEAVEAALPGFELSNSYFQDMGFDAAIWDPNTGGGNVNISIHNNVFANVLSQPGFGFGDSSAVFVPDAASNIRIFDNVFDNKRNALELDSASGVVVENNIFNNSAGADIAGGSNVTIDHNFRYNSNPNSQAWNVSGTLGAGNILSSTPPGYNASGNRLTNWYVPTGASSNLVDKGIGGQKNLLGVALPYAGSAPDIGAVEYGQALSLGSNYTTGPTITTNNTVYSGPPNTTITTVPATTTTTTSTTVASSDETIANGTYQLDNVGAGQAEQTDSYQGASIYNVTY